MIWAIRLQSWPLSDLKLVLEGDSLVVVVSATDPEDDAITLFIDPVLENMVFVDSGNGVGVLTYTPDYYQANIDTIQFVAVDDGTPNVSDVEHVVVTTLDVNRPPVITPIGPNRLCLLGRFHLLIHVTATDSTDPDGGRLYLSALKKPVGSTFKDSTTNAGLFKWKPTSAQVGVDTLKIDLF